ncbi:MAG: ribosome silencing factor [Rhodobacteraceae bacterium]|jgi:ribosome-associated protein|nr:ribosome silencing factor [Alphaproteobacteria bacterium]MBT8475445.1 ribosome silencing factor [Alphaproteobacteria bacterium]NNF71086.1 ribosome silencing factor [Paracoccaceae bacterium]NNK66039.1 ribosome silencing factor [Paracoccaceae bacterium]RZW01871.1 MAG: ribosome silencing factor [Paracoccaceae bacterium]
MPCAGADRRSAKEDNVLSQLHDAVRAPTAPDHAMSKGPASASSRASLERILSSLEDDKAEDVIVIDLAGKSEMADHMVICSGRSSRQVSAISEKLVDRLKQELGILSKVEGKDAGDWVLIDTGDVVVHVFRPEVREFYQLEKMWLSPAEQASAKP